MGRISDPRRTGKSEVGADGKRDAALASRIFIGAKLDDGASRAVAGGIEMGQPDVMGAAVDTVGIGGALQLIIKTTVDQATDDGHVKVSPARR